MRKGDLGVRLGLVVRVDAVLVDVGRHLFAVGLTGGVAGADAARRQVLRPGSGGAQHLDLTVRDVGVVERVRRLHRHQTHQLQQVVLQHVLPCPVAVVVPRPARQRERLVPDHLDALDVGVGPHRFEDAIGEASSDDVVGGLLAEEVVDAEHGLLVEAPVDQVVQSLGRLRVGPERLLHEESAPLGQVDVDQRLDRVGEHRRRQGEVHERRAGVVERVGERVGVGRVGAHEHHRVDESLLGLLVDVGSLTQRLGGPLLEPLGRHVVAAHPDNREVVAEFAGLRQLRERRHEVPHRHVAQPDHDHPADHDVAPPWRASRTALRDVTAQATIRRRTTSGGVEGRTMTDRAQVGAVSDVDAAEDGAGLTGVRRR